MCAVKYSRSVRPTRLRVVNLLLLAVKVFRLVAEETSSDVRRLLLIIKLARSVKPVKVIDVSLLFCAAKLVRFATRDASSDVRKLS